MGDIGAVATFFNTLADIWRKRPSRLRKQALDAAKEYISIDRTGKHRGRKLSAKSIEKWKLHYFKQVEAWS